MAFGSIKTKINDTVIQPVKDATAIAIAAFLLAIVALVVAVVK